MSPIRGRSSPSIARPSPWVPYMGGVPEGGVCHHDDVPGRAVLGGQDGPRVRVEICRRLLWLLRGPHSSYPGIPNASLPPPSGASRGPSGRSGSEDCQLSQTRL